MVLHLQQWFSQGAVSSSREHLAMSGPIFGNHTQEQGGGCWAGEGFYQKVEARDAAKLVAHMGQLPTTHIQSVCSAELEKP